VKSLALGLVYCRPAKCQFAIEPLNTSINLRKDKANAFDLFVLAMSYHQLGDAALTGNYYARPLHPQSRVELTPQMLEGLNAFGAEAAVLLGGHLGPERK
jgi:hypothetical protein